MSPIIFSPGTHESMFHTLATSFATIATTISGYVEKCTAYIANIFSLYGRSLDARCYVWFIWSPAGKSLLSLGHMAVD